MPTQSLVPEVLADVASKEEFVDRLGEGDDYFASLRDEARKDDMVVRYVGVVDVNAGTVEAKLGKWVDVESEH